MDKKDNKENDKKLRLKMYEDVSTIKWYVIVAFWIWLIITLMEFIVSGLLVTFLSGDYS